MTEDLAKADRLKDIFTKIDIIAAIMDTFGAFKANRGKMVVGSTIST